jgi:hypothetical protein
MAEEGFFENLSQADLSGLAQNIKEGARDEWLGVDDFTRFLKYAKEGDFTKALKSLGTGALELGGTALMFVPGGQVAGLAAKGGAVGKLGKGLKFLKPLTLEEQAAARLAKSGGATRNLLSAPSTGIDDIIGKSIVVNPPTDAKVDGLRSILNKIPRPQIIGYGPGGYAGSLARGAGQFTGAFPAEQGLLARRAFAARNAGAPISGSARVGEALSGKLGSAATRTGVDTQIMSGFLNNAQSPAMQQNLIDLYVSDLTQGTNNVPQITSLADAIMAELLGGISPQAAM